MNDQIKMVRGLQASYDGMGAKDADTLYFCTDSGNVYLGEKQLTDKVSYTKPGTGVVGTLYVENNIGYVWNGTQYVALLPQVVTAITAEGASETKLVSEKAVVDYVKTAPVTIVFVADKERSKTARPTGVYVDAGTMGQSCYLAAAAMGLAGCIRASFDHEELRKAMNLTEHLEPIVLFTVGYPK